MRTTVKSYLKTIEKAKAETKIAIPPAGDDPVQPDQTNTTTNGQEEANGSVFTTKDSGPPNEEERETTPAIDIQPSIEVSCPFPLSACSQSYAHTKDAGSRPRHLRTRRRSC